MVLAIDASRAAEPQKTGVGWYAYHLISHLKEVIPDDVGVSLYSDRPLPNELRPWPTNWEERVLHWPPWGAHPNLRMYPNATNTIFGSFGCHSDHSDAHRWPLWSQLRLAERVLRDRPDVLFVPAHVIPFALAMTPRAVRPRLITTIHDVVFKEFPEAYSRRERWYADHATRLAVHHADRIIVPTRHVAQELERWYRTDQGRIAVVHHGVSDANDANAHANDANIRGIRMPFVDSHRYLLYVGRLEYKKNIVRMIQAFERIASQFTNLRLILAGQSGHGYAQVRAAVNQSTVRSRIVTPGWISQEEYRHLLSQATIFLFPTLAEGFGLPILEVMAAGVPVITSRGGAHEEVAGEAAVLVRSDDIEGIAHAMHRLLSDVAHREKFVRLGRQRVAQFTWERTAKATWEVLRSVLST